MSMQTFVVQSARATNRLYRESEGRSIETFLVLDTVRQLAIVRSVRVEDAFSDCGFDVPISSKSLAVVLLSSKAKSLSYASTRLWWKIRWLYTRRRAVLGTSSQSPHIEHWIAGAR